MGKLLKSQGYLGDFRLSDEQVIIHSSLVDVDGGSISADTGGGELDFSQANVRKHPADGFKTITVVTNFDSMTGIYLTKIVFADDTDFYTVGADYYAYATAIAIGGGAETPNEILGMFSIENRF